MEITVSVELTTFNCPTCGGIFAISKSYREEAHKLGGFKKCWTLERAKKWAEDRQADALKEAEHFRKSRDGVRGALTKQMNRIGNGVCPCCNRSFVNLKRHMTSKHPQFTSTKLT